MKIMIFVLLSLSSCGVVSAGDFLKSFFGSTASVPQQPQTGQRDPQEQIAALKLQLKRLELLRGQTTRALENEHEALEQKKEELKKFEEHTHNLEAKGRELVQEKEKLESTILELRIKISEGQQRVEELQKKIEGLTKSLKDAQAREEALKQEHAQELTTASEQAKLINVFQNELENKELALAGNKKEAEDAIKILKEQLAQAQQERNEAVVLRDAFLSHNVTQLALPNEKSDLWQPMSHNQRWYELKDDIRKGYFNTDYHTANGCSIARLLCFLPESIDKDAVPRFVSIIHGTFANAQEYSEDMQPFFRAIKRYMEFEGSKHKAPVIFLSFQWQGANSHESRVMGGDSYAKIINRSFSYPRWHTTHIAHSHGGTMLIWALRNAWWPAGKVILLATPPREGEDRRFVPENIEDLHLFWSDTDSVQGLGSVDGKTWWSLLASPFGGGSSRKMNTNNEKVKVRNIRVMINAKSPGHSQIKHVLWALHAIETRIHDRFRVHADLQLDLITKKEVHDAHKALLTVPLLMSVRNPDMYIANVDSNDEIIKSKITKALCYSNAKKDLFKTIYGKEMDAKAYGILRMIQGLDTYRNDPGHGPANIWATNEAENFADSVNLVDKQNNVNTTDNNTPLLQDTQEEVVSQEDIETLETKFDRVESNGEDNNA